MTEGEQTAVASAEAVMALLRNSKENPFKARFKQYSEQLDETNERYERLVKASRDVTIQSKKVIFQLHRISSGNKEKVLEQALRAITKVRDVIVNRICSELTADTFPKFHRTYSPGLQEYVEARAFFAFCQDGTLMTIENMQTEISADFGMPPSDYVLGIADLTGELMRKAVARGGDEAVRIHDFMCEIEDGMDGLQERFKIHKEMFNKMKVLKQSMAKVQRSCFDHAIRRAELPFVTCQKVSSPDEPFSKKQKTIT